MLFVLYYQLSFFGVPLRAGLSATTPRLPALASASNEGALWGIRCYPSRTENSFMFSICFAKRKGNKELLIEWLLYFFILSLFTFFCLALQGGISPIKSGLFVLKKYHANHY